VGEVGVRAELHVHDGLVLHPSAPAPSPTGTAGSTRARRIADAVLDAVQSLAALADRAVAVGLAEVVEVFQAADRCARKAECQERWVHRTPHRVSSLRDAET